MYIYIYIYIYTYLWGNPSGVVHYIQYVHIHVYCTVFKSPCTLPLGSNPHVKASPPY